jgi:hypothetical protein
MQHPFEGVVTPGQEPTRRDALGTMIAAALGVGGLAANAAAQFPNATTEAVGEEGGIATTLAIGEEGGATTKALGEEGATAAVTTEPFGEEAGRVLSNRVQGLEDGAAAKPMPSTRAVGEEGGPVVTTLALGEEGNPVITQALNETGVRPGGILVQPGSFDLKKEQLESAWKDLSSTDAGKALQGCALIYGHKKPVDFLKENLKVDVKADEADEIADLIKKLDDNAPKVRSKAQADLEKKGIAAIPALHKAAKNPASPEVTRRVTEILGKVKDNPNYLQMQRGVEVLVALKNDESKALLETLAKSTPETVVSHLANEALNRKDQPMKPVPVNPGIQIQPGIKIQIQRGALPVEPE